MSDKPLVKCSVSNCKFWGDYRCQAEEIMIDIDKHATSSHNEEFGNEFGADHKDIAAKSSVTCCQTFVQK